MNKRKIAIFILTIILIVLIGIIIFNVFFTTPRKASENGNSDSNIVTFDSDNYKYLDFCSTGDCPLGKMEYQVLKSNSDYSNVREAVEKVNSSVLDFYEISNQSTACADSSLGVIHSNAGITFVSLYQDKDLLNLTFIGNDMNLCDLTYSNFQFYSFYYDIASSKSLSQEDIMARYNITENEVLNAIENEVQNRNIAEGKTYSYSGSGYHIYVDNSGEIMCYFMTDGNSMSTSLNKKVN